MKEIKKKPEALVKRSVHERVLTRGDEGEEKPLIDKKGGPIGRPTGERPYNRGSKYP